MDLLLAASGSSRRRVPAQGHRAHASWPQLSCALQSPAGALAAFFCLCGAWVAFPFPRLTWGLLLVGAAAPCAPAGCGMLPGNWAPLGSAWGEGPSLGTGLELASTGEAQVEGPQSLGPSLLILLKGTPRPKQQRSSPLPAADCCQARAHPQASCPAGPLAASGG